MTAPTEKSRSIIDKTSSSLPLFSNDKSFEHNLTNLRKRSYSTTINNIFIEV